MEPKLSEDDLQCLTDSVLETISSELFLKSGYGDRLGEISINEKGFFSVFLDAIRQLVEEDRRIYDRMFGNITPAWQKALKSSMIPKSLSAFDDIKHALRATEGIHKAYESYLSGICRTIAERDMSLYLQAKHMVDPSTYQELSKLLRSPMIDAAREAASEKTLFQSMVAANASIANILDKTIARQYIDQDKSAVAAMSTAISFSESRVVNQFAAMGEISLGASGLLAGINLSDIRNHYPISARHMAVLESSFLGFTGSYSELLKSFESPQVNVEALDCFVKELPPVEIYTGAGLARIVSRTGKDEEAFPFEPDLVENIEDSLEEMLGELDPGLVTAWRGAKHAMKGDNPDKFRHVTVSLRELLTHVLHKTAPDEEVMKWTSNPKHFLKDRPTRAARLLFICRGVNNGPFSDFMKKDVVSNLAFIDVFQKGTHGLNITFTEPQMKALFVRTEALLRFILTVSRSN
ncbi:MAG: hypothetical protein M0024_10445 [Nitrospiraceae bacterium]|nr:hypothetical protein [Nitrospiraceae bacterium]